MITFICPENHTKKLSQLDALEDFVLCDTCNKSYSKHDGTVLIEGEGIMKNRESYHLIKWGDYYIENYSISSGQISLLLTDDESKAFQFVIESSIKDTDIHFNKLIAMHPSAKIIHYQVIRTEEYAVKESKKDTIEKPKCYTPNNDDYPLCKGNMKSEHHCLQCNLYENMEEEE